MNSRPSDSHPASDTPSSPQARTHELITRYYAAFNNSDPAGMLELLSDDEKGWTTAISEWLAAQGLSASA